MKTVTINPGNVSFQVNDGETILSAALKNGLVVPYGCKDGACGSCKAKITTGKIDYGTYQKRALSEFEKKINEGVRRMKRAADTSRNGSAKKTRQEGAAQDQDIISLADFCDELNRELQENYPSAPQGASGQDSGGPPIELWKVMWQGAAIIHGKHRPERHFITYETRTEDGVMHCHVDWVKYDRSHDQAERFDYHNYLLE